MRHWYNNGIIMKWVEEGTQPEGFILGRLPYKDPDAYHEHMSAALKGRKGVSRPHTQEEKDKISATLKAKGGTAGSFKKGLQSWIKGLTIEDERVQRMVNSYKATCREKYGVDNYTQSQLYKDRVKEMNKKSYDTKKKNNSFNKSLPELLLLNYYKNIFGETDVETQYSSDEYPFSCDIHIKSINKYIELNGTWTHGKHPFDSTNADDVAIVLQWEEKSCLCTDKANYFKTAIYVWTVLDVEKLQVAKQNNLDYEAIYITKRTKNAIFFSNGLQIQIDKEV